jgi:hypothetical protein
MTSAGVEAGATGEIDAAASLGESVVDGEIVAASSIAQDGMIYFIDAYGRQTRRTKPLPC